MLDSSVSGRISVSSLRASTGWVVVPSINSQTDTAALLLQLPLPDMDVYKIDMRLMQDELASVQGRCSTSYSAIEEAVRQRDNAWKELMDERG